MMDTPIAADSLIGWTIGGAEIVSTQHLFLKLWRQDEAFAPARRRVEVWIDSEEDLNLAEVDY